LLGGHSAEADLRRCVSSGSTDDGCVRSSSPCLGGVCSFSRSSTRSPGAASRSETGYAKQAGLSFPDHGIRFALRIGPSVGRPPGTGPDTPLRERSRFPLRRPLFPGGATAREVAGPDLNRGLSRPCRTRLVEMRQRPYHVGKAELLPGSRPCDQRHFLAPRCPPRIGAQASGGTVCTWRCAPLCTIASKPLVISMARSLLTDFPLCGGPASNRPAQLHVARGQWSRTPCAVHWRALPQDLVAPGADSPATILGFW